MACASGIERDSGYMTAARLALAVKSRGLDPSLVVHPFAADDEMKLWLEDAIPPIPDPQARLGLLQDKLVQEWGLEMEYRRDYTGTAYEVFRDRQANCLAYTFLFVALARELDLAVQFLEVGDFEVERREGDLVVLSGHVAAGLGEPPDRAIYDFSAESAAEYRSLRSLTDMEAVALYYSNRGAEELLAGRLEQAEEALELALRLAPRLADSWVNLGVVKRRSGDADGASTAYRNALALDPGNRAAMGNLEMLGRVDGEAYAAMPGRAEILMTRGDLSFIDGRYREAASYYRRALTELDDRAEVYAAVGLVALASRRTESARLWLAQAQRIDPLEARTRRLEVLLKKTDRGAGRIWQGSELLAPGLQSVGKPGNSQRQKGDQDEDSSSDPPGRDHWPRREDQGRRPG
jgi:tetratricopeptide (TPR) repeat protein